MKSFLLLIVPVLFAALPAVASDFPVASPAEFSAAVARLHAGDTVSLQNGIWTDAHLILSGNGIENQPIVLRSHSGYGSVILNGTSSLMIGGTWLTIDGLKFEGGYCLGGAVVEFRSSRNVESSHCRLTNSAIISYNPSNDSLACKWVSIWGDHNRVDHCRFDGKTNAGSTVVVWRKDESPNYHLIDHNYFGNRPFLGYNGAESIRIGTGAESYSSSFTVVEYNYFEHCSGEAEIISNKSCDNIYRYNTFINCQGSLTLRQGARCRVEGNIFFANHEPKSGGIRIIGEDHVVVNNYISGCAGTDRRSAICIMDGSADDSGSAYPRVQRALIAFNTLVDNDRNIILGARKASETGLPPVNCTVANNIIVADNGPVDSESDSASHLLFEGNIFYGSEPGLAAPGLGFTVTDPKLSKAGVDGVRHLAASSPAVNASVGTFSEVTEDAGGIRRDSRPDVGAEEYSTDRWVRKPLTPSDVGPLATALPPVTIRTTEQSSGSTGKTK